MTTEIAFTWDRGQIGALLTDAPEKALLRALSKSIRDAGRAMKAASTRSVRFRKRIKVKRVNESLPLKFSYGSSIEDLEARMDVSADPIPVAEFPHRQTSRGVSVAINAGRRVMITSAFEARMRSGHLGVFKRRGKARLPIDELYSTRVSDVFSDNGMIPAVQARAEMVFSQTFDRVFPLELDKLDRKAG